MKIRSFKDIVLQKFYDEIENRISLYVERNFREMQFNSQKVDRVDEAQVQDTELHRIVPYDTFGDALTFDAIVVAEMEIYQVDRNMDLDDSVQKWFRVTCEVLADDGFSDFRIINVDDEYDHTVNNSQDRLDDIRR
jgi:hypothetical protein